VKGRSEEGESDFTVTPSLWKREDGYASIGRSALIGERLDPGEDGLRGPEGRVSDEGKDLPRGKPH